MPITKQDVEHVAALARLELGEEEKESLTEQLGKILEYADKLKELDTEGVPPTAHPLPIKNVFREDRVRPSLPVEDALANAPEREGSFFKVPRIMETD
ncbi:MAG TPA: Asp-tRNA(Asn)/Glu-tRNA(Gln) amidotransferase subunit GatC [Firmicutes bacterium]|nr:Asp-tRNA(Asn)/Glu-tRNA(Gln) amidotransferase subunit GatC [Bacillota bacterium]